MAEKVIEIDDAIECRPSKGPRIAKAIGLISIILIVVIIIIGMCQETDPKIVNQYDWASWDGSAENMPSANIPVYVAQVDKMSFGSANIVGVARNRTSRRLNYIQVVFGVYNGEAKTGSCLANISGLDVGEDWQFSAYCPSWPDNNARYKIDDVAYW